MANSPFRILNPDGSEPQSIGGLPTETAQGRADMNRGKSSAQLAIAAASRARADGDQEAYQVLMDEATDAYNAENADGATAGNSGWQNFRAGMGRGMTNVARHAANLLSPDDLTIPNMGGPMAGRAPQKANAGVTDADLADAGQLDAALLRTDGGKTGSFIGETATLAPLGGPASGTVARVGGAGVAKALAKPLVRGMAEGAGQGAMMADPGQKLQGAAWGAAGGAALPAVAAGAKGAVRGMTRTPEAQALLDEGVDLTPGQMNPRGWYNQFEEGTQSAPFTGSMVKGARDNARLSFNQVAAEKVAAPGAQLQKDNPRAMLDAAYQSFQPLYDQAKGFPIVTIKGKPVIVNQGANTPLASEFAKIVASGGTTNSVRNRVHKFLENEFSQKLTTSDDLLKMRSTVRERIRNAKQSTGNKNELGDEAKLLEQAEQAITRALDSQLPPDAMRVLRAADKQYSQYKTLEDALFRANNAPDGATPTQLGNAARDASTDPAGYARGKRDMIGDFAQKGTAAMETQVPPTGARAAQLALAIPTSGLSYAIPAVVSGTKTGRRLAAGQTRAQKAAQAMTDAVLPHVNPDVRRALRSEMQAAAIVAAMQNARGSE